MSNVRAWLSGGHVHFFNLQLGLLELQEETPPADIDQDNVSLAGVLQGAVGHAVDTPCARTPCSRCCWTIIRGFHTIAGGMEHAVGTRLDAVFPILQRLVHADFAAVEIGFYAQFFRLLIRAFTGGATYMTTASAILEVATRGARQC